MPSVQMSINSRNRLLRSLSVYEMELNEMVDAIGEQATIMFPKTFRPNIDL